MKLKATFLAFILAAFSWQADHTAKADNFTFAIGEWPPHISESLPGYGPQAQLISETFKKAGHDVTFQFMKWNRAFELVKNGQADGSFSWTKTPERAADVSYPNTPIHSTTTYAYYPKSKHPNGLGASTLEDLHAKGYRFVGVKGYWYESAFKNIGAKASMVSDASSAWKSLNAGRADVYLSTDSVADTEMALHLGDKASNIAFESTPTQVQEQFPIFSNTDKGKAAMAIFDANIK